MIRRTLFFLFIQVSLFGGVWGQWMQPNRIKAGASLGFGGIHAWGKPTFDIHKGRMCLRLGPGFRYLGAGFTWKMAYFQPKFRQDRILTLSAYYLTDWYLFGSRGEVKKDQHIYMVMPGIHVNLDHRGTVYLEVGAGLAYIHQRLETANGYQPTDDFAPMGEVRIGGIFLSRKEFHQTFPPGGKPEAKRIKKKKLQFK